jgi:NAD(P)-dependent dehydrogenase (short-subunit alcohol dehydrogenase family)
MRLSKARIRKWFGENTASLQGKRVAVSGSTGGLGTALCRHLGELGASLILLDRNAARSTRHRDALLERFGEGMTVVCVPMDLEDLASVEAAAMRLIELDVDVLFHNAGAYSIPRYKCESGYDNVFQINFASPYYLTRRLLPHLRAKGGRVVAVGSIAHRYSHTDPRDVDFSQRKAASLVYGNAKRHLMAALYALFEEENGAHLAVVHPGITFTNITAHYPKVIFALIKHPMRWIFMDTHWAALSLVRGMFEDTATMEWIGPRLLDVWGLPKKKRLRSIGTEEFAEIAQNAETVYEVCASAAKTE